MRRIEGVKGAGVLEAAVKVGDVEVLKEARAPLEITLYQGPMCSPLGIRRGNTSWGDGGNTQQWIDLTTKSSASPHRDGDCNEPASDRPKALPKSPNQDAGTGLLGGFSDRRGGGGRGRYPSTRAMPRTFRQTEIEPECKEIDDIVKSMRQILWNQNNEIGGRLSVEDDEAVQAVLKYHHKYSEKVGCGIAYIKVDNSPDYPDVRCFWLVRTDGSATDFSFRKCLREKVLREFPSFVDKYDELYDRKRPPPINAAEKGERKVHLPTRWRK